MVFSRREKGRGVLINDLERLDPLAWVVVDEGRFRRQG
jgi:hypothetical protein